MKTKLRCSVSLAALALASGLAVSSPTSAADIPVKAFSPAPVISWQGFYLGAHAGWGVARHSGSYNEGDSAVFGSQLNLQGALVGFHAGYLWDRGNWIFGLEADVSFKRWRGNSFSSGSSDFMVGELNALASIRARIGIPVNANRSGFLYATGGAAWVNANATAYDGVLGDPGTLAQRLNFDGLGGVIGAGFEWAATPQLRLRIESLYYIFNISQAVTAIDGVLPGDHIKLNNVWTVRVGATWYFNAR